MFMANEDAYVSKKEFKKLKTKVDYMADMHKGDDELAPEEKALLEKAKKDAKTKKKAFTQVDEL